MRKRLHFLILAALLSQGFAHAQNSVAMPVPYGSFEQWTTHPSYSVTALFIPIQVYSEYSTPTGWDYLTYPVNETYSYMSMNININTDLPLIKASQETGSVPDSSSAVRLQTFMLSDIISSTVYALASGSLDSTLTQTVYPSILTTGAMNLDHFIPLMNTMMANMDSLEALLLSFASMDMNYLFNGGLSLAGFEPSRLTGSYKYHSAVGGDNGGVVILGTRYNPTLHKRELVGGGLNIHLTDTAAYTPFTVDYRSLHDYDSSFAEQTPDSMIVMLVSSASLNRQQGSYLCIDNLVLWHDSVFVPEPDTCARITSIEVDTVDLTLTPDTLLSGYVATWLSSFEPEAWEVEYGLADFTPGTGAAAVVQTPSVAFNPLSPGRLYELRVRTRCSDSLQGDWEMLQFFTLDTAFPPDTTIIPPDTTIIPPDTTIIPPDTTIVPPDTTIVPPDTTIVPPDTTVFIRDQFSTLNSQFSISPNPAHGQCVVDLVAVKEAELRLYTLDGRLLYALVTRDPKVTLLLPRSGVFLLQVITPEGILSRKIINR